MAIAVDASSSTGTGDAFQTSISVPVPAGTAAGKVAIVLFEAWESAALADTDIAPPAGFVYIDRVLFGQEKLFAYGKRLTTTDTGVYTFDWTAVGQQWTLGHCLLLSGVVASGSFLDATPVQNTAGSGNPPNLSITTVTAGCGLIYAVANESAGVHGPPTGFTEAQESDYLATNHRVVGAAGSQSATSATLTGGSSSQALLFALTPAAAGGGAVDLAATTPAAASAAGVITITRPLAAAAPVAASATGAATITRPLAGSAPVAASATGTASAARALAGAAPAPVDATGAIATTRPLAALAAAASGADGALTVSTLAALAGSSPTASSAGATLAVTRSLTGDGPASDSGSGSINTARDLATGAPATSSAAGALTVALTIAGAAAAASSATGTLTATPATINLAGTAELTPPWTAQLTASPWTATLYRNGRSMVTEQRHMLDIEPVRGRVRTTADPTGSAITVAVLPVDQVPKPGDWKPADWTADPVTTEIDRTTGRTWYYAHWATNDGIEATQRGTLEAHIKIIDGSFTIVLKAGELNFRP